MTTRPAQQWAYDHDLTTCAEACAKAHRLDRRSIGEDFARVHGCSVDRAMHLIRQRAREKGLIP